MTALESLINSFTSWLLSNILNIFYSIFITILIYGIYRFSTRQIERFQKDGLFDETIAFTLRRVFQWSSTLAIIVFTITQFGIKIDLIAGLFFLAGGTVIGFAAMNTLGNSIAGIILITSRPFKIGDRVLFDGTYADVERIDLIYTRMITTDNVMISIPNQKLLQTEIENFGKDRTVRRRHAITVGYEDEPENVETALLEAARLVDGILETPEPYVWMTEFQNFAVEYTLLVYINQPQHLLQLDSAMRNAIFEACQKYGIDISTPSLIRSAK